ncbi:hypothetical protein R80B4_00934 [Fibrobacteres bacterium R8-0-B4]
MEAKDQKDLQDFLNGAVFSPTPYPPANGEVSVHVKNAKFPLDWNATYYAINARNGIAEKPCAGCGGKGRIALMDGRDGDCPRCGGAGVVKDCFATEYDVIACRLDTLTLSKRAAVAVFADKRGSDYRAYAVEDGDFSTMRVSDPYEDYKFVRHIYDNRDEAQAEADRLSGLKKGDEK